MSNIGELADRRRRRPVLRRVCRTGRSTCSASSRRASPSRQATTVTWIWKTDETPHTVTFLGGQPAPEVVVPQPQPSGPPKLKLNPQVLAPAGDNSKWAGGTVPELRLPAADARPADADVHGDVRPARDVRLRVPAARGHGRDDRSGVKLSAASRKSRVLCVLASILSPRRIRCFVRETDLLPSSG